METPGFLPAWSLPQPQPTPSMEAQSQLEGSMLTPSPPAPRQALCRLWGQEDSCRCAQPGQLPRTTSHTARRTFGDRRLKVAVLTTSAGSSGQRRGSRSRTTPGFPLARCPLSSWAVAAGPSGAGDAELLPRLRGHIPTQAQSWFPAVSAQQWRSGCPASVERALSIYFCSFSFQDEIKLQRAKNKPFFKAMHQRIP